MEKLQTQNELLEAKYFQVEELEERLETCWQGQEWVSSGHWDQTYGTTWIDTSYQRPC